MKCLPASWLSNSSIAFSDTDLLLQFCLRYDDSTSANEVVFACNVGGKKRSTKGRDTEIDYENVTLPLNADSCNSEAIPVEKLKWYTKSNADLITRQYEVG